VFAGLHSSIRAILKNKNKKERVNLEAIRKRVACIRTHSIMTLLRIHKSSNCITKKMIQIKESLIKRRGNQLAAIIMIVFKNTMVKKYKS
jgi:hypothetical protein